MHLTQKQNVQILTEQEHDRSEVSLDILSNKNSATEAENKKSKADLHFSWNDYCSVHMTHIFYHL